MSYVADEFSERARRVFTPRRAGSGNVKCTITGCAEALGIKWNRARDLIRKRLKPHVEEMDKIRELDGVWCPVERKAKPDLMERMHDKIDALYAAYVERRERKRSRKPIMERLSQD